jgi:hypothetical protein
MHAPKPSALSADSSPPVGVYARPDESSVGRLTGALTMLMEILVILAIIAVALYIVRRIA